ncbi:hypothetical protein ACFWYW_39700 [Nonomuraea sp. NPDC059023]
MHVRQGEAAPAQGQAVDGGAARGGARTERQGREQREQEPDQPWVSLK